MPALTDAQVLGVKRADVLLRRPYARLVNVWAKIEGSFLTLYDDKLKVTKSIPADLITEIVWKDSKS